MLVTSILSLSISVFRSLLSQSCLTLSQTSPWFLCVCSTSHLKALWEKEKLLITSNFSFSHSAFSPFGELSAIFIKFEIVICNLFQFGGVLNLLFGKGLKLKLCSKTFNLNQTTEFGRYQIQSTC